MALVSCTELKTRSGTLNKDESSYTRTFRVITDDPDDGPQTVRGYLLSQKGIAYGVAYSSGNDADVSSRVKSINCNQISEDGRHWDITVTYGKFDSDSTSTSPLDEPPKYQWGFHQFESPVHKDIDGNPVLNSAQDPFADPITRDDSRPVLTISRNEASFAAALAYQYRDSVNADTFQGAMRGTVKCSNISATRKYDGDIGFYWTVSYEFHFNVEGWKKEILDAGYRYLDGTSQKPITKNGQPVNDPALLDGDGGILEQDADPEYLEFEIYPELPFSVFNF